MRRIWFTSDTHLGHANIITYCGRPFASVEEQDETLLANINALVQPDDTLYHLGDFAWRGQDLPAIRARINCRNISVLVGNHDDRKLLGRVFDKVADLSYLKVAETGRFLLCHYPLESWHPSYDQLHGHVHSARPTGQAPRVQNGRTRTIRLDVGVDAWDYKPVSLDQLLAYKESLYV